MIPAFLLMLLVDGQVGASTSRPNIVWSFDAVELVVDLLGDGSHTAPVEADLRSAVATVLGRSQIRIAGGLELNQFMLASRASGRPLGPPVLLLQVATKPAGGLNGIGFHIWLRLFDPNGGVLIYRESGMVSAVDLTARLRAAATTVAEQLTSDYRRARSRGLASSAPTITETSPLDSLPLVRQISLITARTILGCCK